MTPISSQLIGQSSDCAGRAFTAIRTIPTPNTFGEIIFNPSFISVTALTCVRERFAGNIISILSLTPIFSIFDPYFDPYFYFDGGLADVATRASGYGVDANFGFVMTLDV